MLSTPKKGAKKNEPSAPSETASFKKVAYGFSPDEVNLYLHSLRKKNLELQTENDALTAAHDPDIAVRMENLERNLAEANERYLKEKELTSMLEVECGRLGEDLHKLTGKLSQSGSSAEQATAKIAEAEANVKKAEVKAAKAEARVVDAEANLAEATANLNKAQKKVSEYEIRATEYQTIIAEHEKKLREYEAKLKTAEAGLAKAASAPKAQATAPAPAIAAPSFDDMLDDIPDIPAAPAPAAASAASRTAPAAAAKTPAKAAPRAASEVDLDFAEFQVPSVDAPIFEEAPELGEGLADKLSNVLAEIDDLKSRLTQAKAAEAAELEALEAKKKKTKKEEDSINNARLSRAELKIQIFQEEAEDSYIIPEKYLKMIEDAEAQDDDDELSYLLSDANPLADMSAADDDDDDMNSFMVSPPPVAAPSLSKAPPPAPRKPQPQQPAAAASPIKMAPRPAPTQQKPEPDAAFAAKLNSDFKKAEPKGANIAAKNPLAAERGADLKPNNPLVVEKGADLDEDLFELMVGDAVSPSKNVRANVEEAIGYDFMLDTDDAEII
ncbi:MAG: hypothetical protein FWD48_11580 [Oscillospiraceae bacterium]|nr:hypothetical protein [Oscillospiraceae bacterium]